MASFGMLCLLSLMMSSMTLTSTWAVSLGRTAEERATSEARERRENLITRLLISEIREEATLKGHEEVVEGLIRGYLENEAARLARSGSFGPAGKSRRSLQADENKESMPFSTRRFKKMLEKAIFKIITGDLSNADIALLKSLNYSLEEVLAIRERELGKKLRDSEIPKALRSVQSPKEENLDRGTEGTGTGSQSMTESSVPSREEPEDIGDAEKPAEDTATPSSKKAADEAEDFDFDAYNRQAVLDYENAANRMSQQELDSQSSVADYDDQSAKPRATDDDLHNSFDRAMESHVVFKIRYDDSEFDSTSNERARQLSKELRDSLRAAKTVKTVKTPEQGNRNVIGRGESRGKLGSSMIAKAASWSASKLSASGINATPGLHEDRTFQPASRVDLRSPMPVVYRLGNFVKPQEDITDRATTDDLGAPKTPPGDPDTRGKSESKGSEKALDDRRSTLQSDNVRVDLMVKNKSVDDFGTGSNLYEGLEWVEDDVYRVIPQALDELNYDNDLDDDTVEDADGNINRTSESMMLYDDRNDTASYQNEDPDEDGQSQPITTNSSTKMPVNVGLTTYQQMALAHRRDQGQKAIEDIKLRVLAITGRYNLSSSSNQVQRERLTMFSPICQAPRNTDLETWSDPFSMNMYFQLNLTSGDHVVAAKMRIYKLPQIDVTVPPGAPAVEEEDEEEKKIRISIYFYTKSLKKHRSKKRLMDSVVTSLTSHGSHLALDVRQALRFWRQNLRSSTHGGNGNNTNNHGLVIQVEDQDGRPLKPSQYIQQGSCHTSEQNQDDKAYQRDPALFVQACARYVRVVNGEAVTYVNCSKSLRNDRH